MTELLKFTVPGHITPQGWEMPPGRRPYRSKAYRQCIRKIALLTARALTGKDGYPRTKPTGVEYTIWRCGKFDEDKLTGTIWDGLEAGGVVKNDCYLTLLKPPEVEKVPKAEEKVVITVKEL